MRLLSSILSTILLAAPVFAAAEEPMLYEDTMMNEEDTMMNEDDSMKIEEDHMMKVDHSMNMEESLDSLSGTLSEEITRSAFISIVMNAFYPAPEFDNCLEEMDSNPKPPRNYSLLFHDVTTRHEDALQLCRAMRAGIINGYEDGNFRPDRTINLAESAKVLSRVFALSHNSEYASEYQRNDWYASYIQLLIDQKAIPMSIHHVAQNVTRTEVMDMVERLQNSDMSQATRTYEYLTR